jgi:alkylation response protein AidB-like acyl-CoA dehydrogenase
VNLDFTGDQRALHETLRDFFEKESPPAVVRAAEPAGFDPSLWRKLTELGLVAAAIPGGDGGDAAGLVELAIAAELLGSALAPVPLIEAVTAGRLLTEYAGQEAFGEFGGLDVLKSLAAGERLATIALHPAVPGASGTSGTSGASGASGAVARLVPAGAVADLVVVLRGEELLLVEQPVKPAAAIPNLGAMPLADCPVPGDAIVLARGPEAVAAHWRAVRRWELLTAAALAGLAAKALDIGVRYVLQRRAFGVLIGSFQTIQHRLADNATAIDGARLLAYKAAWAHDAGRPDAADLASTAFLFASETAFKTASESLHFHGGYGYTLEYDIQLYFRRAKAWPLVAGDRRAGYASLARRLYAPASVLSGG